MLSVDIEFTRQLPKIELHAHLTGSVSRECLHDIWLAKRDENENFDLEDPIVAIPDGKVDYDVGIFFALFSKYTYLLINDPQSVTQCTAAVLSDFANDGVCYLELRTTPRQSQSMTKDDYVSTILDCIDKHASPSMKTFLILSVDRKNSAREAIEVANLAVKYRNRGVVGLDLCGDPSKDCDVSVFREAFTIAKSHGLGIALHFAEVLASSSTKELSTLLSFGPDRLGHVVNTDEASKNEILARKVALEMCLSCNVHAKLTHGGFEGHHFGEWWRKQGRGPITLGTDDVGIFLSPLSNEFLLAAQYFGLNRKDLLELCIESADSIFAGSQQKARIKKLIFDKWGSLLDI